jgi:hypothetical protein
VPAGFGSPSGAAGHPEVDAGYIYLVRPRPSWHFEKLAAPGQKRSRSRTATTWTSTHDGHLFGIELLGRADVFAKLKEADAL